MLTLLTGGLLRHSHWLFPWVSLAQGHPGNWCRAVPSLCSTASAHGTLVQDPVLTDCHHYEG